MRKSSSDRTRDKGDLVLKIYLKNKNKIKCPPGEARDTKSIQ